MCGIVRGVEVEARLVQHGIDVAAHDRLDVVDRRFLALSRSSSATLFETTTAIPTMTSDRRRDDDHADARPPAQARDRSGGRQVGGDAMPWC